MPRTSRFPIVTPHFFCFALLFLRSRSVPQPDDVDSELEVTGVSVDGDWTSVTFLRSTLALDDQVRSRNRTADCALYAGCGFSEV